MKIIHVHSSEETNVRDPRSYEHYWTSSWNKTWKKKIQAVGLLAQLVECCNSIAKVMGSNPIQAWIFFRSYFNY